MSIYDQRRDPVPPPDMARVDARQPGTSGAPQTTYVWGPTSGHKLPAARHRAQIQLNGMSGERLGDQLRARLDAELDGLGENDRHMARREMAHGIAIGAYARSSELAGSLGGGQWLADPAVTALKPIFGVS